MVILVIGILNDVQSAMYGPDPDGAVRTYAQRDDGMVIQGVGITLIGKEPCDPACPGIITVKPVMCSYPDVFFVVLWHGDDPVITQAVGIIGIVPQGFEAVFVPYIPVQTFIRTDPEIAVRIFEKFPVFYMVGSKIIIT